MMCPQACHREGCGFAPLPEPGSCKDDPAWRDDMGNSCSAEVITAEWCRDYGHERFPGYGDCGEDDRRCKPGNEACCVCKNAGTCVDATTEELFHEWGPVGGQRVTCEEVAHSCGHAIYGESVTKMCPVTCKRPGCAGAGQMEDEDGEDEVQDTAAVQKANGGCRDATAAETQKEWGKKVSCGDLDSTMCAHAEYGEEVARMCPITCGTCIPEPEPEGGSGGKGSSSAGIIVAIVAGVAMVAAGFGALAYYRSRNREMLNQSYVSLAADGGIGEP